MTQVLGIAFAFLVLLALQYKASLLKRSGFRAVVGVLFAIYAGLNSLDRFAHKSTISHEPYTSLLPLIRDYCLAWRTNWLPILFFLVILIWAIWLIVSDRHGSKRNLAQDGPDLERKAG
ncbi:MAG: hypothetical protein JW941_13545 [Candidatus Coatesbacteria bacterium]|nr:hypothetical protein [Candidatus Coatesbacteria bacterium]